MRTLEILQSLRETIEADMRDSKEIDIPGLTIALYRIESAIAKESASIHESEVSK